MYTLKVLGDFINGGFVRPRGATHRIISLDPGDAGYRIGSFPIYPEHADLAVQSARTAWESWHRLDFTERADVLRKFSAEVVNHRNQLKSLISAETGKPLWEAEEELSVVESLVECEIREGVRAVSPFTVSAVQWAVDGSCHYKSLGVVVVLGAAISPLLTPCSHIIPALLSGNSVVFKPSKLAPATGQYLAQLFEQIDLPRGVFNLVQGEAEVGAALASHEAVDGVLFSGSYPAGRRLLKATSALPHKLVALQMGGINVALVLADADLERALYETITGAFLTSGQRFTSTAVILIERPLFASFQEAFLETVKLLKVGYSSDPEVFMGPLLSGAAMDRFLALQKRMSKLGVKTILPSHPLKLDKPGFYVGPAVHTLEYPDKLSNFMPEGLSFGPDVVLMAVKDAAEGIQLANSTQYPFGSALFTEDFRRFEELSSGLHFGVINFNIATTSFSLRLPLVGARKCANNRPFGVFSQRNCTYPVATLKARNPFDPERALPVYPKRSKK